MGNTGAEKVEGANRPWYHGLPAHWPRIEQDAGLGRRIRWSAEVALLGGSLAALLFVSHWLRTEQSIPPIMWLAGAPFVVFSTCLAVRSVIDSWQQPTRSSIAWSDGWIRWFLTIGVLLVGGIGAARVRGWAMLPGVAMFIVGLIALAATAMHLRKPVE